MADFSERGSWLDRRMQEAFREALIRAYKTVRVHPDEFLAHLQRVHSMPVQSYREMFALPVADLDSIAQQTLRGAMKIAAAEGAGMGLGGFATAVPDLGILSAITVRMLQKLSLVYGFEYNTDEELAELWIAAATAAGVDLGKDLLEKTVLRNVADRVVARLADRLGAEFAEKIAARALPLVSSVVGGVMNYYFVRTWGNRAVAHFRQRHLVERRRRELRGPVLIAPARPASQ